MGLLAKSQRLVCQRWFLGIQASAATSTSIKALLPQYFLSFKPSFGALRSFVYCHSHSTSDTKQPLISLDKIKKDDKKTVGHKERLMKVSKILNCTVEKVKIMVLKFDFLMDMNLDVLQDRVQLMVSYGVPYPVIHKYLRSVAYVSTESLTNRLKMLQENSLLDYKFAGFYLYCSRRELVRGLNYVSKNKEALAGCADQLEYVQQRLQLSELESKKLLSSTPFKRGYSAVRLKKQLDFFLEEAKVDSDYLIRNFILLNYSVERLRHRLKVMESAGITDTYLWRKYWRFTPEEFNETFEEQTEIL